MPIEIRYDSPGLLIGAAYEGGVGQGAYEARKTAEAFAIQRSAQAIDQQRIQVAAQGQALSYAAQLASIRSHEAQQSRALAAQQADHDAQRQFQAEQNALARTAAEESMRSQWDARSSYEINLLRERQHLKEQDEAQAHNRQVQYVEEARSAGTLNDEQYEMAKRQAMLGGDPSKLTSLRQYEPAIEPIDDFGTYKVRQPNGDIDIKVGAKRSKMWGQDELEQKTFTIQRADGSAIEGVMMPNGQPHFFPAAKEDRDSSDREALNFIGDAMKSGQTVEEATMAYDKIKMVTELRKAQIAMPPEGAVNPVWPSAKEKTENYIHRVQSQPAGSVFYNPAVRQWMIWNPAVMQRRAS